MNPAVCGVENIAGAEDPPLPPVANCPVGLKQNLDNFTETGHSHQFRLLPPQYIITTYPLTIDDFLGSELLPSSQRVPRFTT